jgi:hypothetical protein
MKFNICIIQPKGYIHSMAFWELGELLLYSLRDLNHETCIQFNAIDTSAKNIIIGFHLLDIAYARQLPKDTILINAEQLMSATSWNEAIFSWCRYFEVWDYSSKNIEALKSKGINNIKLLKIGYQRELKRIISTQKQDIDVLFYGSINSRRSFILKALEKDGLNVKSLFGVYGHERDSYIARSKIILNLHFYETQIFEIIRIFYLLTNEIPVVAEANLTTHIPEHFRNAVKAVQYEELIYACKLMVENTEMRRFQARQGFEIIKDYTQATYTAELL